MVLRIDSSRQACCCSCWRSCADTVAVVADGAVDGIVVFGQRSG